MRPFGLAAPFILAPMCDFLELGRYCVKVGAPDLIHIEYARVHGTTNFEDKWIKFIEEVGPQHKVIAQLMGEDIPAMQAAVERVQDLPIAGVDLNMGCPVPKIFKKNVGGGLLRQLEAADAIIGAMREKIKPGMPFSVKFRLGFDEPDAWETVLAILKKHQVDWGTIHLRTVADGYRAPVRPEFGRAVVAAAPCPMVVNGDIQSVDQGRALIAQTGAWGCMVGRGAIRYPWIFARAKHPDAPLPTYADAWDYYQWILQTCGRIGAAKGYLNFLGLSIEPTGKFLKAMRTVQKFEELEGVGREWILSRGAEPLPELPFESLYARPSIEKPKGLTPDEVAQLKRQAAAEKYCG